MLHHVALSVPPELAERCEAFWSALGFEPVQAPPALAERARWLERAGTQVHLLLDPEARPPDGGDHVAVSTPDYEAALAALARTGARIEHRAEHWGAPRAYVYDPVGHRVEVMARPPAPSAASAPTPRPPAPA